MDLCNKYERGKRERERSREDLKNEGVTERKRDIETFSLREGERLRKDVKREGKRDRGRKTDRHREGERELMNQLIRERRRD